MQARALGQRSFKGIREFKSSKGLSAGTVYWQRVFKGSKGLRESEGLRVARF